MHENAKQMVDTLKTQRAEAMTSKPFSAAYAESHAAAVAAFVAEVERKIAEIEADPAAYEARLAAHAQWADSIGSEFGL
jgi:hypothetical protein